MTKHILWLIAMLLAGGLFGQDDWSVFFTDKQAVNGVAGSPLNSSVLSIKSKDGILVGPIVVWKEPESGRELQVSNSISVADAAIKQSTAHLSDFHKKSAIRVIVSSLCRRDQAMFLGMGAKEHFLGQMAEKTSKKEAELVASLLPEPTETWSDDTWGITICAVTHSGAIEKYTFEGTTRPLGISKQMIELIGPAGTVKSFAYIPGFIGR